MRLRATDALDVDLVTRRWVCNRCDYDVGDAERPYKFGCLVRDRDPAEIYPPVFGSEHPFRLTTLPDYGRFVEYYCPGCGVMVEVELLPPGHPPDDDLWLDLDAIQARLREDPTTFEPVLVTDEFFKEGGGHAH